MKAGKCWGTTELLLRTPFVEVHRLIINPHARCSMHKHEQKWNAFVCQAGRLFIDVRKNDYKLVDTTELGPMELMTVKPGEFHQFRTGPDGAQALEIYYPEPLSEDIVRENVGSSGALEGRT